MPEGDTVWLHARTLHEALAGRTLTGAELRVPRLATCDLTGWAVAESVSRGKHLLLRLAAPDGRRLTLHSHLRMDGSWRLYPPGRPWRGRPARQIRAVLATEQVTAVGFHLHELALVPTAEEEGLVGHLGPDLLGADWDPDDAVRRLRRDPHREISEALLDQTRLSGIGNLYRCEVLFLRRIWPWRPVSEVPDLGSVVDLAHRLLRANRHRWAQITTGAAGRGEGTWVHGRAGRPCCRCGTPIRLDGPPPTDAGEQHHPRRAETAAGEPHRAHRSATPHAQSHPTHRGPAPRAERHQNPASDRITYWCPTCQTL